MLCCAVTHCASQATNTATVTPTDGGAPVADTATVTLQVTGCTGAVGTATATALTGASALTVSNLKTVVVNTYTWWVLGLGWCQQALRVAGPSTLCFVSSGRRCAGFRPAGCCVWAGGVLCIWDLQYTLGMTISVVVVVGCLLCVTQ